MIWAGVLTDFALCLLSVDRSFLQLDTWLLRRYAELADGAVLKRGDTS
jgi:hypothetical protein